MYSWFPTAYEKQNHSDATQLHFLESKVFFHFSDYGTYWIPLSKRIHTYFLMICLILLYHHYHQFHYYYHQYYVYFYYCYYHYHHCYCYS
jgi:hypothetical protein